MINVEAYLLLHDKAVPICEAWYFGLSWFKVVLSSSSSALGMDHRGLPHHMGLVDITSVYTRALKRLAHIWNLKSDKKIILIILMNPK